MPYSHTAPANNIAAFDAATIRSMFPALVESEQTYLDSAATTQKPRPVVETIERYHSARTANAGRGTYPWATALSEEIADVRDRSKRFINAEHWDEVVFTDGATAALNAVAMSWGLNVLDDGDQILYSPHDHASAVYPWHHLRGVLARFGRHIDLVPYRTTQHGEADTDDIAAKVSARTRLIATSHLHHVFGARTTLQELRNRVDPAILLCFDCSQSGGHMPVDVTELRADFAIFAGHKMFGAPGTGMLYCRRRVHPDLLPFLPGGGSAVRVGDSGLEPTTMPQALEGGTPNIPGILALGTALELLETVGMATIAAHNHALTMRLIEGLRAVPGLEFLPGPAFDATASGYGIVSFTLDSISAADLGFVLAEFGFLVRTGAHCMPDSNETEQPSVRVSTHIYNTADDIEHFIDCVHTIAEEVT